MDQKSFERFSPGLEWFVSFIKMRSILSTGNICTAGLSVSLLFCINVCHRLIDSKMISSNF